MFVDQLVRDAKKLAEMTAVGMFISVQATLMIGVIWFFTA